MDIFKALGRVWYEVLIFKLRSYGISNSLLCLSNSFLSESLQRVALNGQVSEWRKVLAGVPQGSILGPLLFLIFINDISTSFECNVKIFTPFSLVRDPSESLAKLDRDLGRVAGWSYQWKMSFNPDPSKQSVVVHLFRKFNPVDTPSVYVNNPTVDSAKLINI